jgi:hypothetical protein
LIRGRLRELRYAGAPHASITASPEEILFDIDVDGSRYL